MSIQELLTSDSIQGDLVTLPETILDQKDYPKVSGILQKIGGKGGRVPGVQFKKKPGKLLEDIPDREEKSRRVYQSFSTPPVIGDSIVTYADIYPDDRVLEPSAGNGALIRAVHRLYPEMIVHYCDLLKDQLLEVGQMQHVKRVADDFLTYLSDELYDVIVAHPPITGGQDIDHINHMWKHLRPGGRLVSVASRRWEQLGATTKEQKFYLWLLARNAEIKNLPVGTFKKAGNTSLSCIVIINKPVV